MTMTREEAIELLRHILMTYEPKDQYGDYDDPEPYEQALTMAIEALQDRPTGKWLKRQTIGNVDFAYCSICNEPIIHKHTAPLWSICPNCGADMRGKEE